MSATDGQLVKPAFAAHWQAKSHATAPLLFDGAGFAGLPFRSPPIRGVWSAARRCRRSLVPRRFRGAGASRRSTKRFFCLRVRASWFPSGPFRLSRQFGSSPCRAPVRPGPSDRLSSPAGSLRSGRSTARSGPEASRVRGCEPRPRAPLPAPLQRTPLEAPLTGRAKGL